MIGNMVKRSLLNEDFGAHDALNEVWKTRETPIGKRGKLLFAQFATRHHQVVSTLLTTGVALLIKIIMEE